MKKLRPYQKYCYDAFFKSIKEGKKNICVALYTGTGKTFLASAIAEKFLNKNKLIIFITPRLSLLEQTKESFEYLEEKYSEIQIIQGNREYNNNGMIYIASARTLINRELKFKPELIINDESHIGYNKSTQQKIYEKFPDSIFLSLTATPCDADGLPYNYDKIIKYENKKYFIQQGYLCKVESYIPYTPDLKNIDLIGKDYNQKQLDQKFNNSYVINNIINKTHDLIKDTKLLVFCISIKHAEMMNQELKERGFNSRVYHSNIHNQIRKEILEDYKNNKFNTIVSVAALAEGLDVPDVNCILLARPTRSIPLFHQIIGRGMRVAEGKDKCKVIDVGGCIENISLPEEEIIPRLKTKNKKLCNKCNTELTELYSKIIKQNNVLIKKTVYKCQNNHKIIKENIIEPPICEQCSYVFNHSNTDFIENENSYQLISECPKCGYKKTIRNIEKIDINEIKKIESDFMTTNDIVDKIKQSNIKNKDLILTYANFIINKIDNKIQHSVITTLYELGLREYSITDIQNKLRRKIEVESIEKNVYRNLDNKMNENIINMLLKHNFNKQTHNDKILDRINKIITFYNSNSSKACSDQTITKAVNAFGKLIEEYPNMKSYIIKTINTRMNTINKKQQKMAAIQYFPNWLKEQQEII